MAFGLVHQPRTEVVYLYFESIDPSIKAHLQRAVYAKRTATLERVKRKIHGLSVLLVYN